MDMDLYTVRSEERAQRYWRLIEIGIALSAERNNDRLMEHILVGAKALTNADGGTLYLVSPDGRELRFMIVLNDTMNLSLGGADGGPIPYEPLPLYEPDGSPNHKNVSAASALSGRTFNIADAYDTERYDFSHMGAFDAPTGYHSQSFLSVPLKNHDSEVVGVIELINARSSDGQTIPFLTEVELAIQALASQAAVALDKQKLIDAQRNLFRRLLVLLGGAIDAKSHYTGGHCHRVPELTAMLARAADAAESEPFADFHLTENDWYQLEVASGLHDCGKVTTKEYVVDKATKLETLYNRIHEIRTRFEVVKRDAEIEYLKAVIAGGDEKALREALDRRFSQLEDDFAFVADCNIGGEVMAPEKIERLQQIGSISWLRTFDDRLGISRDEMERMAPEVPPLPALEKLLEDKPNHVVPHDAPPLASNNRWGFIIKPPAAKFNLGEIYNLSIRRGTLTAEERYHINDHIMQTIIMLESLEWPKNLSKVAEWAGGHHEKMDGTGYPRGLKREQMSIPARIMMIADIFEALTARDRPYKPPKKLSECMNIMAQMSRERHIDADLFQLFLKSGVYQEYADRFLMPDQMDEVDITRYFATAETAAAPV